MTVTTTSSRVEYTGNGVTTAFSVNFYFLANGDLKVYQNGTLKALTTHYTVTGAGNPAGGTVTFLSAPTNGHSIVIFRDPALTQSVDYQANDPFPAETHEQALDRLTMIAQRLDDRLDRAAVLPDTVLSTVSAALPTPSAGKALLWNSDADGLENSTDDFNDIVTDATTQATNAASSASAAATSASNAATSETNAAASETTASQWATKTTGQVAATDYSSKAYAIGGTGVTNTSGKGAAKEWATTTGGTVDTSEFSAKEYAQGSTATGGTAKDWAQKTSAAVTGSSYSAKEWATGTQTRGAASGGSAKDWANYTSGTVDNAEYSAKKYATDAAASAASAQAIVDSVGFRDVVFITNADSPYTVTQAHSGKLISVDTSGGAVVINQPTISGITLPFTNGVKKTTGDANTVTINRGGASDTFDDGSTALTLSAIGGVTLIPDTDSTPDKWTVAQFGAVSGQQIKQQFSAGVGFTAGSSTTITLTETPLPSAKDALVIHFDGAYQQESEWSYVAATGVITFGSAIPGGTSKVECVWSTPLAIGTPADSTVTTSKLATTVISGATEDTTPDASADYVMTYDASAGANKKVRIDRYVGSAGPFQFKNRLLNPRGEIYIRAVAATADDTYFADRWYVLSQTGTVTPSALSAPEDGYPVGIRITQSQASAQRFGFAQIIEGKNCKNMRGGAGALTPRIRVSNSQAIRYAILGWTSTEDSVTSDVVNDWTSSTYTANNFFLASNVSVIAVGAQTPSANTWTTLTTLTASLGSSFNNIICMVWTEGTAAQNFTLDFDYVQFEAGSISTPFEVRSFGVEERLCERYLPHHTGSYIMGQCTSTTAVSIPVQFRVKARVTPTGITLGAAASSYQVTNNAGTGVNCATLTLAAGGSTSASLLSATVAAGLTAGNATFLAMGGNNILFDGCEL